MSECGEGDAEGVGVGRTPQTKTEPVEDPAAQWRSSGPRQALLQTPPTAKPGAAMDGCTWKLRASVTFTTLSLPHVSTEPAQPPTISSFLLIYLQSFLRAMRQLE